MILMFFNITVMADSQTKELLYCIEHIKTTNFRKVIQKKLAKCTKYFINNVP